MANSVEMCVCAAGMLATQTAIGVLAADVFAVRSLLRYSVANGAPVWRCVA
ncbi:hypothetical protein BDSB_21155 [Burkholderia dolosa PC543]|nr:hypothetical protein BDSB_21155 [Burkholderia dolosa PC543]